MPRRPLVIARGCPGAASHSLSPIVLAPTPTGRGAHLSPAPCCIALAPAIEPFTAAPRSLDLTSIASSPHSLVDIPRAAPRPCFFCARLSLPPSRMALALIPAPRCARSPHL
ncbi:hypothetical protein C8J57DRAFT_1504200 [Mycena rebaudengoi]|nr:hypothetical protein C8J57DRAFT_1504200 [Mycena rebaudengoi]